MIELPDKVRKASQESPFDILTASMLGPHEPRPNCSAWSLKVGTGRVSKSPLDIVAAILRNAGTLRKLDLAHVHEVSYESQSNDSM